MRVGDLVSVAACIFISHLAPVMASAQSSQRVSIQISALSTLITANGTRAVGAGVEPQIRINGPFVGKGGLSIGVGGQVTRHFFDDGTLTLKGVLIEPRLTYQKNNLSLARYLSLRAGLLQQTSPAATSTNGYALGAGGGLVKTLNYRTYLDAGVGALYQDFADARTPTGRVYRFSGTLAFVARLGISVGFGK